jgi:hypothetical protein
MKWVFILLIMVLATSGCDYRKRESDLQKKEAALYQKEQELLLREKALMMRENDLLTKEQHLDSASKADSTHLINQKVVGSWSVKMTCTETTCTGSAIGDTKTEQWNISYQANNLIAKAMDNGKLIRVYTGFYTGNTVELIDDRQSTVSQPAAKMVVRLHMVNEITMEGQREITRDNDCKVIYALHMEKQS